MATVAVVVMVWLAFNVLVVYGFIRNAKDEDDSAANVEDVASESSGGPFAAAEDEFCQAA